MHTIVSPLLFKYFNVLGINVWEMIKPPYRNKIGVHVDLFLDIVPTSKANDMS